MRLGDRCSTACVARKVWDYGSEYVLGADFVIKVRSNQCGVTGVRWPVWCNMGQQV